MLPTALASKPLPFSTCSTSAVVVVLPLVPVTATQVESAGLSHQASSTSPMTASLTRAAER